MNASAGLTVIILLHHSLHSFILLICIGNHMISNAIWDKSARENFSKANQIARARRASAICTL